MPKSLQLGGGRSKLMDAWVGSGVQAPQIPRTEGVGSMDGISLQVLTFAGQGTRPVAHPSALLPAQVCGPVRNCYEIEDCRVLKNRRVGAARVGIAIWFVLLFLVVMAFCTAILVAS